MTHIVKEDGSVMDDATAATVVTAQELTLAQWVMLAWRSSASRLIIARLVFFFSRMVMVIRRWLKS